MPFFCPDQVEICCLKEALKRKIQNCLSLQTVQLLLGRLVFVGDLPASSPLGCSGRPCPLADLGDSCILRDGDSITALDIFTVALPCFGFVCLFVRFLYWRTIAGNRGVLHR